MSVQQRKKEEINNLYSILFYIVLSIHLYLVFYLMFDNIIQFLYISSEGYM